jgi:ABC-type multidrug transport system ATPase subunit
MDHFDFDRVEVADVSRHFGRRRAVTRVTLTVRRGEILGLLGPNGAGKSTLIGMLATLVTPTSGRIMYGERPSLRAGPDIRRCIGLLAHELHLYPELSARESDFLHVFILDSRAVVPAALEAAALSDRRTRGVGLFARHAAAARARACAAASAQARAV